MKQEDMRVNLSRNKDVEWNVGESKLIQHSRVRMRDLEWLCPPSTGREQKRAGTSWGQAFLAAGL